MVRHTLGPADFAALAIGGAMGSGPLFGPAEALRTFGLPPSLALGAYLLGGAAGMAGALTFAELGTMHPGRGGIYAFIRDAFGRLPAFLFGWVLVGLLAGSAVAQVADAAATYAGQAVPWAGAHHRLVALAVIVASALVHVHGTRASMELLRAVVASQTAIIVLVAVLVLVRRAGHGGGFDLASPPLPDPEMALPPLYAIVTWNFSGFENAVYMASESRDLDRALPRGLAAGVGVLAAVYVLMVLAYSALGDTSHGGSFDEASRRLFGAALGRLGWPAWIAVHVAAYFAIAHVVLLASARVMAAMAEDGLFFGSMTALDPRHGSPANAIVTASVIAAAWCWVQLPGWAGDTITLLVWGFLALGASSIFVFRVRFPAAERPFRVPLYPLAPLLFVGTAAGMLFLVLRAGLAAGVGTYAVLVSGACLYSLWIARGRAHRHGH